MIIADIVMICIFAGNIITMQATNSWIHLKDPRPKKEKGVIILSKEQEKRLQEDTDSLLGNVLEVVSVGSMVRDENIRAAVGKMVVVDTRMPVYFAPTDEEGSVVIVVPENQILGVL